MYWWLRGGGGGDTGCGMWDYTGGGGEGGGGTPYDDQYTMLGGLDPHFELGSIP